MNHLNEKELVLALDGEMEEAELKLAVEHLAECDECRKKWEGLQGLSARVAEYSASLYEKPFAADERRLTLIENKEELSFPAWGWGLVAAVVLMAVSLAFWNVSHSSNRHPVAQEQKVRDEGGARVAVNSPALQSHRDASSNSRPQDDKSNLNDKTTRKPKLSPASHKGRALSSAPAQQNAANQFTELPFSNAALPLDQATVVRVTLPASALRQAGVVVNEDNADAMVKADVVLGMDGLPRGIRLVNSGSSGTAN
jgi:cytoskeletal protein RodZ